MSNALLFNFAEGHSFPADVYVNDRKKVFKLSLIFQDPYAFIEFANNSAAAQALVTLNHRRCLEKEMKVNWATSNGHGGPAQGGAPPGGGAGGGAPGPKVDTSSHHHIFVGDLRSAHSRFFTPLFIYGYDKKLAISPKFSESGRKKS